MEIISIIPDAQIRSNSDSVPILSVSPDASRFMYVAAVRGRVYVSENAFAIIERVGMARKPSLACVLDFMINNHVDSIYSGIEGILKVPPGFKCSLADPLTISRYWPDLVPLKKSSNLALVDEVSRLLGGISLELLGGRRVFCEVSGGMDSSLIATYASECSNTLTLYHRRQYGALADELTYAQQVGEWLGHVLVVEDGAASWVFKNIDLVPLHSEPNSGVIYHDAKQRDARIARRTGSDIYASGIGGDELFTAHPFHLLDLLLSLKIRPYVSNAVRFKRSGSVFAITKDFPWNQIRWYAPPGTLGDLNGVKLFRWVPRWVDPDFARRYRLFRRAKLARLMCTYFQDYLLYERTADDQRFWQAQCCSSQGLTFVTPFLDHRLWNAMASVDPRVWIGTGHFKPILRNIEKSRLPSSVYSHYKADYTDVVVEGLEKERASIRQFVADSVSTYVGLANTAVVTQLVDRAIGGQLDRWRDLVKWFGLEIWLRQFPRDSVVSSMLGA